MRTYDPLKDVSSVIAILSRISVWGGFTDEQQAKIYQRLEVGTFKKGEYIFCKGDQPTHIYIVKSGKIDLLASDQDVSVQKETVETGGCFGIASLMAMQPQMVTALAAEDSEVMVLSRQALLGLRYENLDMFALLMMNIARELARRLKAADDMILRHLHEHKDG
ncbi:MAG: transcriptional activator FtrB [Syntrophorhabdus sp. PtaU1.Bin002]|nr:MAG: transcriptional activator FtrB [Syntrophorhabdus sp. PtaB.Bin006]OPY67725.1 MAG: transcriptional activator FtrB [Syntrophorhabdus sp. PtaU1.Bin002]